MPYKLIVAAEYDETLTKVKELKLVMSVQADAFMRYQAGQVVKVSGREYVLGERGLVDSDCVHYKLIAKK